MHFATAGHALEFSTEMVNSAGPMSTLGRLQERPTRGTQEGYDHAVDLAYTVSAEWAAMAREQRVAALALKASHGVAEKPEMRELARAVAAHTERATGRYLPEQAGESIAALAVLQRRHQIEGKPDVPRAQYAKAVGITRQSASEPRWSDLFREAERIVTAQYRDGSRLLADRLRDVGIPVRRH
jgi:hypothetical protein